MKLYKMMSYLLIFYFSFSQVNSIAESVLLSFYNMTENLPWIAMNETINIITNDLDNTRIIMSGILSELDMDINSTDFYSGVLFTFWTLLFTLRL